MADGTFKYRAFLSYSHADREWGEWLHHALETYAIPKELIGQQRGPGSVPAKLRPIFRDRFDMEAGHSLREQVVEALKASDAFIVVCSPRSAQSSYVNEEVRQFKLLGRSHRIFPIIVGGIPGDVQQDCFPGALRRQVAADGSLTDQTEEPLAADAREEGDGKELAILKLIAGIIGIDLDEVRKREAIELKRRQRRATALAVLMGLLAIAAMGAAVYAYTKRNEAVAAQAEAERRYEQALGMTLRFVTSAATFRSLLDGSRFGTAQVEAKGESDDFQKFLQTAKEPDDIWFRLVKVLVDFEKDLPAEMSRFGSRLDESQMRLQWLRHAELILGGLERRHPARPEYTALHAEIGREMARLESNPAADPQETRGGS